jgi:hypothetical protein
MINILSRADKLMNLQPTILSNVRDMLCNPLHTKTQTAIVQNTDLVTMASGVCFIVSSVFLTARILQVLLKYNDPQDRTSCLDKIIPSALSTVMTHEVFQIALNVQKFMALNAPIRWSLSLSASVFTNKILSETWIIQTLGSNGLERLLVQPIN